ncbi:MAG: hypothetical protein NT029_11715 [Armatimonadetes bacterium]|nr:hypothetical protein [Armatimonadota bacterium]
MACTVDITREQEQAARLRASRLGLDLAGYLARLIDADSGGACDEANRQAMQLIRQWKAEDDAMRAREAEQADTVVA